MYEIIILKLTTKMEKTNDCNKIVLVDCDIYIGT